MPELIPGGRAAGRSPSDFDPAQLAIGTEVELEHTVSRAVAQEIAMDHLVEDPGYYRWLIPAERAHERSLGALPPGPTVEDGLLAIGALAGGLATAVGIVMVARGREKELYPFAIAGAVTTAFVSAARFLGREG